MGYQIVQTKSEIHASTHERLLRHNLDILSMIVSYPETRPYFYENAKLQDLPTDSYELRRHLRANADWYPESLHIMAGLSDKWPNSAE